MSSQAVILLYESQAPDIVEVLGAMEGQSRVDARVRLVYVQLSMLLGCSTERVFSTHTCVCACAPGS